MKPLKIYLADLTYTTLSLASDTFPLNVGYIASYCKKKFGKNVDIRIFKYVKNLESAIRENPPNILGLSNYQWNFNLGLAFFELVKKLSPNTITVMGGPNVPHVSSEREEFLHNNPLIDFYVMNEGEAGFSNLVEKVFDVPDNIKKLKLNPVDGIVHQIDSKEIIMGSMLKRVKTLDEVPSPYLGGFLDEFFDGKLTPTVQTNRGCPFTCTFCDEGMSWWTKVNYFPLDVVKAELDYIGQRAPGRIDDLRFTDSNFAMFERDMEICEHVAKIRKDKNYPKIVLTSTGKNKKERIVEAAKVLGGAMDVRASVQSMDIEVLKNIKRQNIDLEVIKDVAKNSIDYGLKTSTELILGLPGETFESHLKSLSLSLESGIGNIVAYNLMLLQGTEMANDVEKFGLKTKYRVNAMDFGKLSDGTVAAEIGKVVYQTNNMSFEDYLESRSYHLLIQIFYNSGGFAPMFRLMKVSNVPILNFFKKLKEKIHKAPKSFKELYDSFVASTEGELWDSHDELLAHIKKDEVYEQLCKGEFGQNLLQTYHGIAIECIDQWKNYVYECFRDTIGEASAEPQTKTMIKDVNDFCFNRLHQIWGNDRLDNNPFNEFSYNISEWMNNTEEVDLKNYEFSQPTKITFNLTAQQDIYIKENLKRYGRSPTGIGRIVSNLVGLKEVLRQPLIK